MLTGLSTLVAEKMTLKIAIFVLFLFFAGTESKSELLKEWLNFVTDIFDWKKAETVDTKNQMNFEGLEVTSIVIG